MFNRFITASGVFIKCKICGRNNALHMHWADARDIAIVSAGAESGFTEPNLRESRVNTLVYTH